MALTDKQVKFIDEYMIDMNATAAYLRAGYKCSEAAARSSACDLLANPNISAEIAKRQQKAQEDSGISVQWVLNNLKYLAERCMTPEPLADKEGNIVEWRFDSSGANKALESIGKHLGMFTDKVKMDMSGGLNNTNQDLTNMDADERRARINELNRRRGNGASTTA